MFNDRQRILSIKVKGSYILMGRWPTLGHVFVQFMIV